MSNVREAIKADLRELLRAQHADLLGLLREQHAEIERLREALREIADETYDSWTNGAKAQRIAKSALKEPATEPAIRARGQEDKT